MDTGKGHPLISIPISRSNEREALKASSPPIDIPDIPGNGWNMMSYEQCQKNPARGHAFPGGTGHGGSDGHSDAYSGDDLVIMDNALYMSNDMDNVRNVSCSAATVVDNKQPGHNDLRVATTGKKTTAAMISDPMTSDPSPRADEYAVVIHKPARGTVTSDPSPTADENAVMITDTKARGTVTCDSGPRPDEHAVVIAKNNRATLNSDLVISDPSPAADDDALFIIDNACYSPIEFEVRCGAPEAVYIRCETKCDNVETSDNGIKDNVNISEIKDD
jgi:phage gp16-like protein